MPARKAAELGVREISERVGWAVAARRQVFDHVERQIQKIKFVDVCRIERRCVDVGCRAVNNLNGAGSEDRAEFSIERDRLAVGIEDGADGQREHFLGNDLRVRFRRFNQKYKSSRLRDDIAQRA